MKQWMVVCIDKESGEQWAKFYKYKRTAQRYAEWIVDATVSVSMFCYSYSCGYELYCPYV